MREREVIRTIKDREGNILALCNQFMGWSPVSVERAIREIESKLISYYVDLDNIGKVDIRIINGAHGKYLGTDKDRTIRNNLDDLPTC